MITRIFEDREWMIIDENTDFYVGRCGSGHTVFGEPAHLFKILKNHLVFKTDSGALVKTTKGYLRTVGKAANNGYWIGLGDRTGQPDYINWDVAYWNEKKLCFDYK